MQVRYQAALRPEGANYSRGDVKLSANGSRAQELENALDFLADVESRDARHARGFRGLGNELVEAIARAADRKSLIVEELADAADQKHFVVLVVASVAAALHR